MFNWLKDFILQHIIARMEKLTPNEYRAREAFMAKLKINERTAKPVVICMIGLVGSGKSTVAKKISALIGGTVIEADTIRVELRKQGGSFEAARTIAEYAAETVYSYGGNPVLDADLVDSKKRAAIIRMGRKRGLKVHFIWVHSDHDVALQRIMDAEYTADGFFAGASTIAKSGKISSGAIVKVRERERRMPLHYRWSSKGGGKWVLKKPPCKILAEIDTTHTHLMEKEVIKTVKKLIPRKRESAP